MATFTKTSGRGVLRLVTTQSSYNPSAGTSVIYWALYLDCSNGLSYHLDATIPASVTIAGTAAWSGKYGFDFRSSTSKLIASGYTTVRHPADGNVGIVVSGYSGATDTGDIGTPGTVSGTMYLIAVPPAPRPLGIDQVTSSGFRYRFQSTGTGGEDTVLEWQAQIATNAAFTAGVRTVSSSGTTTFTGLPAGLTYYARSRGRNSRGWGKWSSVLSQSVGLPAPALTAWAQNATDGLVATWTPPAATNGLVGYRLQVATNAGFTDNVKTVDVGDVRTATVTGLAGGRIYYARVAARTAGGINAYSGSRSTMLVLAAGNLDGWTRVGGTPPAITAYTAEGLRRGVVGTSQALWVESIATGAASISADVLGIQRVITGLVPGKAYRFEASATIAGAPVARSYRLVVVGKSTGTAVTVGTAATVLPGVEFIADSTTATIRIVLAATTAATKAGEFERIAVHRIRVLELATDYGVRLRETIYESNLANHLDLACNSVGASWYVGMDGITRFRLPGTSLPVSFVFTDEEQDDALHYIDVSAAYDTRSMVNDLEVENLGVDADRKNEENDDLRLQNTASVARYGTRSASMTTNLWMKPPYDATLTQRLQSILDVSDEPELLISALRWNAWEDLDAARTLDVGQRILVRFNGREQDSQIVSIDHTITPTRWLITLTLQAQNT